MFAAIPAAKAWKATPVEHHSSIKCAYSGRLSMSCLPRALLFNAPSASLEVPTPNALERSSVLEWSVGPMANSRVASLAPVRSKKLQEDVNSACQECDVHTFGSRQWIDCVYDTKSARDPRGRSRPTHRFAPAFRSQKNPVCMEGGNELTAFLMLEIFQECGLIDRFKPQPFLLNQPGLVATPDFLFEMKDEHGASIQIVVEVKSSAYYTVERQKKCETLSRFFAQYGIRYVVWTTKEHLTRTLWHVVRQVSMSQVLVPSVERTNDLLDVLRRPKTMGSLIDLHYSVDEILHEVWKGRAHFDLTLPIGAETMVGQTPHADTYAHLFHAEPNAEAWWDSLPDA